MKDTMIWMIDDDPIYQIIMKKNIYRSGLFSSYNSFSNGEEAINSLKEIIRNNSILPDIILLDIEMPVLDGWGFMNEIISLKSQINKEIKIYIASSSIAIEDKERAQNNPNVIGYISKPISQEDLKKIIGSE